MALTIHLPQHIRDYLAREVAQGRYESEEAAIVDAVEHAIVRTCWEDDPELLAAIEEADRGEGESRTPELMERLVEGAKENSRRGHRVPDDIKY
jgi:Arc/MetJ-type ribon-helix-helix transcriptional regulator